MYTLITGYRHTPTKQNQYVCFNDSRETFLVDKSLMLSLPFYIKADKVECHLVDSVTFEKTGEVFHRYEATSVYKKKSESLQ